MASLKAIYQGFLTNPNSSVFASNASINYITTLTTINSAVAIGKHISSHQQVLKKKQEKVLSTIESNDALCLDVETTLEFISGGGAYLPGLDDNFVADRVVTFPIVHIVHFDTTQKIQQIRLYWDQGSLLKLVDVIGSRAKNWPIRDGKDQARLILSSAAATTKSQDHSQRDSLPEPTKVEAVRKPVSPKKNVARDPHSSLSLFDLKDDEHEPSPLHPGVATRTSAKPPPRDYHDLFTGNESDASPASRARASSPEKDRYSGHMAQKGGAGRNFQPSRLFDCGEPESNNLEKPWKGLDKSFKTQKYNHFDLADGSEGTNKQPSLPARSKTNKNQSQWDFDDSATPAKVSQKIRPQEVRRFGWNDDDCNLESPAKNPNVIHPRPDASTTFDFQDDSTPAGEQRQAGNPRGQGSNRGLGLYQNNLYDDTELSKSPEKKNHPLSTVTTNLKDRRKDFDPHFTMTDESPASKPGALNDENRPINDTKSKAAKAMNNAHWESSDQSSDTLSKKQTKQAPDDISNQAWGEMDKENRGTSVKTGGDGMGGKKGAGRNWGFGDDSDEDGEGGANGGRFLAGKKQLAPKDNTFWDY